MRATIGNTIRRKVMPVCVLGVVILVSALPHQTFASGKANYGPSVPHAQSTGTPVPNDASSAFRLSAVTYLKIDLALKHRPDGDPLSPKIPKGQSVALMGKTRGKQNTWWYRVVWSTKQGDYVGWIDSNNTDFPEDKLSALRPPPPCAKFLTAVTGARKWTNPKEQNLVVLVDLYRRKPQGSFDSAKFNVLVGGKQLDRWSRPIKPTKGQFLLGRGTAINMGPIKANAELSYSLEASAVKGPVALFTAIFGVPDGCEFESTELSK